MLAQSTEKPEVGGSYNIQEVVNLYKKCKNQKIKKISCSGIHIRKN